MAGGTFDDDEWGLNVEFSHKYLWLIKSTNTTEIWCTIQRKLLYDNKHNKNMECSTNETAL